ncbi:protein phosphatase 1 regulatory subunit 1B isoform X2 [Cynoglossus semilaevis]|uniref:protein phosphatase 1 regulatory subunit 1B isoform X2 n=1 Tax=Cynoglossus semilaevis TaxID=244447 RepID=UPI000497D7B9|nr:protein phosphatase 1 regulatory subunit 1B isoform X2 [Cynoglossus semilaevis]
MEPFMSSEVEGEPKERKKIHFAVPSSAPPNLDPRQVEMIRRRRPTPATLFRVADHTSPEDDQSTHQWVVGENGVLKPKRVSPNVYQPPSLRAVQKMAEAQMQKLGVYPPLEDPCEGEENEDQWEGEKGVEHSPTKAADHPETVTSKRSVKFSCDIEPAQEIQPAQGGQEDEEEGEEEAREEEEDEEEDEGDKSEVATREKSRGNN